MDPKKQTRPGRNGGTLVVGGGGRKKGGFNLEKLLRTLMEENDGELGRSYAKAQIILAMKGNGVAIKEINGRLDGPITEKVETAGVIRVIYEGTDSQPPTISSGADGDLEEPEAI